MAGVVAGLTGVVAGVAGVEPATAGDTCVSGVCALFFWRPVGVAETEVAGGVTRLTGFGAALFGVTRSIKSSGSVGVHSNSQNGSVVSPVIRCRSCLWSTPVNLQSTISLATYRGFFSACNVSGCGQLYRLPMSTTVYLSSTCRLPVVYLSSTTVYLSSTCRLPVVYLSSTTVYHCLPNVYRYAPRFSEDALQVP